MSTPAAQNTILPQLMLQIDAAKARVEAAKQTALDAALHLGNLRFGVSVAIIIGNDPELRQAEENADTTHQALDVARRELSRLETAYAREEAAERVAAQARVERQRKAAAEAEAARRRAWVAEHQPARIAALEQAQAEEQAVLAERFVKDSPSGQQAIGKARAQVQAAEQAIAAAMAQAPAGETTRA